MRITVLILGLFVFFAGCKENADIIVFDTKENYINFSYPNTERNPTQKYVDSIFYSFALDEELGIQEKVLKIPVNIAGSASDLDREYKLTISELSDYDSNLVQLSEPVIRKGRFTDTLYVTISRSAELATKEMSVVLEISDNENFKLGHYFNRKIKISFTDILRQPTWWNTWSAYLGPFKKEVFQKWMQIYYLGADPTPELYDGIPPPYYYWNRMPTFVSATSFPLTIMYLEKLKKYFQDNVVYPNGDTTQPRILLP